MAHIQARYLLRTAHNARAEQIVPQAVSLIHDCVHHLGLPSLAVELALGLQSVAQRWPIWTAWDRALALLLALEAEQLPIAAKFQLLIQRGYVARMSGDQQTSHQAGSEAYRLAEAEHDPALIVEAHNSLGFDAFWRDDLGTAKLHLEQAYIQGRLHLSGLKLGHIRLNLGTIAMHGNDLRAAQQHLEAACDLYRAADEAVALGKAKSNLAELLRRAGQLEDALSMLQQAEATFRHADARYDLGLAQNAIGCVYLSMQRWDLALAALTAAVDEFERIGSLQGKAWVLPNIAELYVSSERWEEAERVLDEAHELALLCERPLIAAAVDVDRGRMLAARGAPGEALRIWQRALSVQEAKGARLAAEHTRQLIERMVAR